MGHADKSMIQIEDSDSKSQLTKEAVEACKTFAQLSLSFLVRTAFPEETMTVKVDSSINMLDKRMKALNYLGSMLS